MRDSVTTRSTGVGVCWEDLAPRRAWMAERMREKVKRHLSHQSVVL